MQQNVEIPQSSFKEVICTGCNNSDRFEQRNKIRTYKGILSSGQLVVQVIPVLVCNFCGHEFKPEDHDKV